MLTPQEIQDKKFEKAMFGGYDMGQIDHFLDEVLADYTDLYKENATLKAKMRVLVEKIEEYRAVDEEMRKALYTAQVSAKSIVDDAQKKASSLLAEAERENESQMASIRLEIAAEEKRLTAAKKGNAEYIGKIKELMRRNIELMDTIMEKPQEELRRESEPPKTRPAPQKDFEIILPEDVAEPAGAMPAGGITEEEAPEQAPPPSAKPGAREAVKVTASAETRSDAGMETRFFEIELGAPNEPQAADTGDESDTAKIYGDTAFTPKPRFDFSDIRFGKDYDEDEE